MEAIPEGMTLEQQTTRRHEFHARTELRRMYQRSPYYMALFARGGHQMRTATAERICDAHSLDVADFLAEHPANDADCVWLVDLVSWLGY